MNITYHPQEKNADTKVKLDGKLVGTIRRHGPFQYQYFPKGSKTGGEVFVSEVKCMRSLENPSETEIISPIDAANNLNDVLRELCEKLTRSRYDLNRYSEITISMSEARETVIVARGAGFDLPLILREETDGTFTEMSPR